MDHLVELLNLRLESFRRVTLMTINSSRHLYSNVATEYEGKMPTKAEQERVSRFFHRHEVDFVPEWFGTDSYRQFSNLWQKFAALVNKQNLKILEKIDPLSFEPEEEILYKKIEGEIDERKQDLQQPLKTFQTTYPCFLEKF